MAYNKGNHGGGGGGGGNRGRSYALMLLLAFGAALLGVMVLHKLRERRIYSLLVKEKDRDLLALQLLLQKERDHGKEMKRKTEEMKAKIYSLRSQKMELDRTVLEMRSTMDSLKEEERVMESAFEEKQNEIKMLQGKVSDLEKENPELIALKEKFQHKEAEVEELKQRFEEAFKSHVLSSCNSTILQGKLSENGTMAAHEKTQTENKQMKEQSQDQSTKYEDGEGIMNEDQIQKRKENNDRLFEPDEQNQRQETLQVDGGSGEAANEMNEKIVDDEENASIRKEQGEEPEDESTVGGQEFSLKPLEDNLKITHEGKRKQVRIRRTKGKRWRTIVKNSLLRNNGISEGHGAAKTRSRKLNRDQKNGKNKEMKEEEMGNENPSKSKAKAEAEEQTLDEDIHSEKQEGSGVEQRWSRRHINLEEMNAGHEKTDTLHKELEEPEVADVQEEKDNINGGDNDEDKDDDFSKESHQEADENEYKGEMHDE